MAVETGSGPRESLARAAKTLAAGLGRSDSLELIAAAAREATGAELAAVHVLDPATGGFVVRAAAPADSPLAAEVLGARTSREGLQARIDREETSTVVVPALADDRLAGALEVFRGAGLDQDDRDLAALVAAQLGLVLLQPPGDGSRSRRPDAAAALEHAGEALVAGATLAESAQHAAWLAADGIGAVGASVWRARDERLELVAVHGD